MSKKQSPGDGIIERLTRTMFTRIITGLATLLSEQDFSIAQIAALHLLDQASAMRVAALAEALQRSPSAVSRLADSLVQRGLVARAEDPDDRRAKILTLTAEGRRFLDRVSLERVKVARATLLSMPAEAREAVLETLKTVR